MYQGYRLMHIRFLSPWSCPVSVSSLCVLSLWLFVFPVWSSEYIFSPAPSIYLFHPFVSSVSRVSVSVYVRSLCQVHVSYLALSVCITYCFILIVLCLMWVMFSCASCVLSVRFCSAVLWQVCPLCSNLLLCTYYLHLPRFFVASFLMVCEHLSICLPINLFLTQLRCCFCCLNMNIENICIHLAKFNYPTALLHYQHWNHKTHKKSCCHIY